MHATKNATYATDVGDGRIESPALSSVRRLSGNVAGRAFQAIRDVAGDQWGEGDKYDFRTAMPGGRI
jgi:hypothetical protein